MGWLAKLLGSVPREERAGIQLDTTQGYWELQGPKTFSELLRSLDGWLPEGAILYFEGGSPSREIEQFMAAHAIPERAHLAMGTIWPRPKVFHVPATPATLKELADLMERQAEPQPAIHFHVYRSDSVLLQWYDAFFDPMQIRSTVAEENIRALADRFGTEYKKVAQ
jgi:hypothetical protein